MSKMRSYNRTSFYLFGLAFVITIALDYFGISISSVISYTNEMVTKTIDNTSKVMLWLWPTVTIIKETIGDWRDSTYARDIEIAKIQAGK